VLQYVAVRCNAIRQISSAVTLQCVAIWCSVLQYVAVCCSVQSQFSSVVTFAVWCSVVQCGAAWCSVLQCVAVSIVNSVAL